MHHIPFREHSHELALVDNQHAAGPRLPHRRNGLLDGHLRREHDSGLQRGQLPNVAPQDHGFRARLIAQALVSDLLFFCNDLFTHTASFVCTRYAQMAPSMGAYPAETDP